MTTQNSNTQAFNSDMHVKELNDRFARLIKQLGPNNRRGSSRYDFEVDFMYAINELQYAPPYLQGKLFDTTSSIVNSLADHVKQMRSTNQTENKEMVEG